MVYSCKCGNREPILEETGERVGKPKIYYMKSGEDPRAPGWFEGFLKMCKNCGEFYPS